MPLRIAHVLPSHVGELVRRYQENGHELEGVQDVNAQDVPSSAHSRVNDLDILVGGSLSADKEIGIVQRLATEARRYYDREDDDLNHLSAFDGLQDKEAGELLKAIALARNAAILPPNMASVFELMAEPFRVAGAIIGNVADEQLFDSITVLDVQNAIESGALIPHHGLPSR